MGLSEWRKRGEHNSFKQETFRSVLPELENLISGSGFTELWDCKMLFIVYYEMLI